MSSRRHVPIFIEDLTLEQAQTILARTKPGLPKPFNSANVSWLEYEIRELQGWIEVWDSEAPRQPSKPLASTAGQCWPTRRLRRVRLKARRRNRRPRPTRRATRRALVKKPSARPTTARAAGSSSR